jgi:hypothetical protein
MTENKNSNKKPQNPQFVVSWWEGEIKWWLEGLYLGHISSLQASRMALLYGCDKVGSARICRCPWLPSPPTVSLFHPHMGGGAVWERAQSSLLSFSGAYSACRPQEYDGRWPNLGNRVVFRGSRQHGCPFSCKLTVHWSVRGYCVAYRKIVEAMISGPETGMAVQLRPTASLVLSVELGGWQITAGPSPKHTYVHSIQKNHIQKNRGSHDFWP